MDEFAHCAQLVRQADRDRFIASLFAPADKRDGLYALYAFNAEIARVREVARQALAGEIRLQWWSDVIAGERTGEARANPVAAALLATIERHRLSPGRLITMVEAHRFDLYDEPMRDLAQLETYARQTSSALFARRGANPRRRRSGRDLRAGRRGVRRDRAAARASASHRAAAILFAGGASG